MVLRNLSTSKGINLDQEGKLRGRAGVVVDHRGFNELAEALLRLGIAERVVDAEVVEEDPPPALPAVRCDGAQMSTAEQDLARRVEELERRVEELTRNHNELAGILRELVEQLQRDQQRKPSDLPRIEGLSAQ